MPEEKNIIVMQFPENSKAFEALSEMKGQPGVISLAVAERTSDGQVRVADGYSQTLGSGIAVGGLVGALIGVIAGPLGVLLGWSSGALFGAVVDSDQAADADDGFTVLSKSIPPGGNALFVEMHETSHAIADDLNAKLKGTITRVPAAEVEAEVVAAQQAARAAAAEAGRARRAERQAGFKERLSALVHHEKSD